MIYLLLKKGNQHFLEEDNRIQVSITLFTIFNVQYTGQKVTPNKNWPQDGPDVGFNRLTKAASLNML